MIHDRVIHVHIKKTWFSKSFLKKVIYFLRTMNVCISFHSSYCYISYPKVEDQEGHSYNAIPRTHMIKNLEKSLWHCLRFHPTIKNAPIQR